MRVIGARVTPSGQEIAGPRLTRLVQLERALDPNQEASVAVAQLPLIGHLDRVLEYIGE